MDIRQNLLAAAERQFYDHGFAATGMDAVARAAGMSSRTLYKHAGSKVELIVAVLDARDRRFFDYVERCEVAALFEAHVRWIADQGAQGCLFLRALGETGGAQPEIAAAVRRHKDRMRAWIDAAVLAAIGRADPVLAARIVLRLPGRGGHPRRGRHGAVPRRAGAARMKATLLVGASGFGLIAVCYGFGRFAFGLFLPQISNDLALSPTLSGVISAGSFAGFCVAIVGAAWLTERFGPRVVAMAAGVLAALGLAGIAGAASPSWLAAAVSVSRKKRRSA